MHGLRGGELQATRERKREKRGKQKDGKKREWKDERGQRNNITYIFV